MKQNKYIVWVCIIITLCSVWYSYYVSTHLPKSIDNFTKNIVNAEAAIIAKKIDKEGIEHVIVSETNNLLPKNLVQSEGLYDAKFVDSLIAQTDIQKKEITSLTQINQTIIGKNKQAIAVIDSLNKKKFEFSDANLYLSYTPNDSDANVAGKFDYKYNQKLNIIAYNRKKWLLGQDHNYMDIASDDINGTINGVKKLSIAQPPKDFESTITAKTIFLPQSGKVGIGGQLRVRYKRVTGTYSNLYIPQSQKWLPVVGLEYDLLQYSR
jgi:hypothetical protein